MGRVIRGRRTNYRGLCVAALVAVAAAWVLLLMAAPAPASKVAGPEGGADQSQPAPSGEPDGAAHKPEEKHEHDPLDHVRDQWHIELFQTFPPHEIKLPYVVIGGYRIGLSKHMLLELIAAGLVLAFYVPLARRMQSGDLPVGWHENVREVLLTFIRDDVAKPGIGHDADKFVPFLWTIFLFILFNNLLGMFPFLGSATGNISVTFGLALCVFFAIHGSGIAKMGFKHYVSSMWPHIDVPYGMGYILKPMIFVLEWMGVLVRNAVLAVRLFANMFAGHVVLATILIFIYMAGTQPIPLWGSVTFLSVLGQVALSLLELFVAFLQAYIFTFLTSLFMGMAMHPAH